MCIRRYTIIYINIFIDICSHIRNYVKNKCTVTPKEVAAKRSCDFFWCKLTPTFLLNQHEANNSPVINVKTFLTGIVLVSINKIKQNIVFEAVIKLL